MKKYKKIFFICFSLLLIANTFYVSYRQIVKRGRKSKEIDVNIAIAEKNTKEQKSFVILVMSYNNASKCRHNLSSIFEQDYENYRVIFIDDCSTDNTYELARKITTEYGKESQMTLLKNEKNKGAMENLFRGIDLCLDDEIVMIVDGDDWLAHDHVISKMNTYYANPKVWMTYGDHLVYPDYKKGIQKPIDKRLFCIGHIRSEHDLLTSHLRTFYAGLFRKVRVSDFLCEGKFFPAGCDQASMLPMMELAGKHVYFVPEIMYIYNCEKPFKEEKIRFASKMFVDQYVKRLTPYSPLQNPPWQESEDIDSVDLVTFSYDRPFQLYAFLESLHENGSHIGQIFVIYRVSNARFFQAYEKLKKIFPHVVYIKQSNEESGKDFKPLLLKTLFYPEYSKSPYVAFAIDDLIVKDHIDFRKCVKSMKRYSAYGFYLRLGENVTYNLMEGSYQGSPQFIKLDKGLVSWQFCSGKGDWHHPNSLALSIFDKKEIKQQLSNIEYMTPKELEKKWDEISNYNLLGMSYKISKVVGLPLDLVATGNNVFFSNIEELLDKFDQGYKFDITPLYQVENHSVQIEYQPHFISRE